jgi:hypothetical protein
MHSQCIKSIDRQLISEEDIFPVAVKGRAERLN